MTEDNPKLTDDLGQEIIAANSEQLKREVELFANNIEQNKKDEANYKTQWEVEKRIYELLLDGDNQRAVNPKIKVEELDEYWDLQKKMLQFKYREVKHLAEGKLKHYEMNNTHLKEQLESAQSKLKELEGVANG